MKSTVADAQSLFFMLVVQYATRQFGINFSIPTQVKFRNDTQNSIFGCSDAGFKKKPDQIVKLTNIQENEPSSFAIPDWILSEDPDACVVNADMASQLLAYRKANSKRTPSKDKPGAGGYMIQYGGPIAVQAERFNTESSYTAEIKQLHDMSNATTLVLHWFEAVPGIWEMMGGTTTGGKNTSQRLPSLHYTPRLNTDSRSASLAVNEPGNSSSQVDFDTRIYVESVNKPLKQSQYHTLAIQREDNAADILGRTESEDAQSNEEDYWIKVAILTNNANYTRENVKMMIDNLQNGEWKPVPKRNDLPKLPAKIQQRLTAIVESSQKKQQLLSTPDNGDKAEEIDNGDEAEEIRNEEQTGNQVNSVAVHGVDDWDYDGHGKKHKKKNKRAKAKASKSANTSTNQNG